MNRDHSIDLFLITSPCRKLNKQWSLRESKGIPKCHFKQGPWIVENKKNTFGSDDLVSFSKQRAKRNRTAARWHDFAFSETGRYLFPKSHECYDYDWKAFNSLHDPGSLGLQVNRLMKWQPLVPTICTRGDWKRDPGLLWRRNLFLFARKLGQGWWEDPALNMI